MADARRPLKTKPLVEAIFELRWALVQRDSGQESDPHFKLVLGRLYDRLQDEYPIHEQLPTANLPDELLSHVIQHRFRKRENGWPLVQIGPGVFAVNSTADYSWEDFRSRTVVAVDRFFDAYPKVALLKISSLSLRYINAVPLDHESEETFDFVRNKLKVDIKMPNGLFQETGVDSRPLSLVLQSNFRSSNPKGVVAMRIATGNVEQKPAVVWETSVQSSGADLPPMIDGFPNWFDAAHRIADDWFFKLIEGDLERRFENG